MQNYYRLDNEQSPEQLKAEWEHFQRNNKVQESNIKSFIMNSFVSNIGPRSRISQVREN